MEIKILTEKELKEWDELRGDIPSSLIEATGYGQAVIIGEKAKRTEFLPGCDNSNTDHTSFCSSAYPPDFKWLLGIEWLEAGK